MIYILSLKDLNKKLKKLAFYKDYVIADCTKDNTAKLHQEYSKVVTVNELCPPDNLMHYNEIKDDDDYTFDYEKVKKEEKMYLCGHYSKVAQASIVESYLQFVEQYGEQKNIFIVLGNKEYKYYGQKLQEAFNKNFDTNINFVRTFDQCEDKKIFEKDLSDKDLRTLQNKLDSLIETLESESKRFRLSTGGKKRGKKTLIGDDDGRKDYDGDDLLFDLSTKKKKKKKKHEGYGPNVDKYLKGLKF